MVVGTTGWYGDLPQVRHSVEKSGTGFLYAANFSIGVNLLFDVAQAAPPASCSIGYSGQIFERHHAQKKDAPSGTAAATLQTSFATHQATSWRSFVREGDVVGMHEIRARFAERHHHLCATTPSRAADLPRARCGPPNGWPGKKGFYDFKDIWRELTRLELLGRQVAPAHVVRA